MEDKKEGKWFPEKIDGDELQEFADWINGWAGYRTHDECANGNKITDFGRGYEKAIEDIIERLNLDWKQFDKRTKTGFRKRG